MNIAAIRGDEGSDLVCPDYLGEIGQQAWRTIRDVARNAGIVDDAGFALELAAAAYEEYRLFKAEVEGCDAAIAAGTGSKASRRISYDEMVKAVKRCHSGLDLFAIRPPSRIDPWSDPLRGMLPTA